MLPGRTYLTIGLALLVCANLFGQRYEPTRPNHVAKSYRHEPTRPGKAFKPTQRRSKTTWRTVAVSDARYEPTRPSEARSYYSGSESAARSDIWSERESTFADARTLNGRYEAVQSRRSDFERLSSGYDDYRKARKWHQKVARGGKNLLNPVRFTLKLGKKALSKASYGWLPLL